MIEIREAKVHEIPKLLDFWIEKSIYLEKKGIPVWNIDQFTIEKLKEKYVSPSYYLGIEDNKIFGAFILLEIDEVYWPGVNDKAFYFHKFMIVNEFSGKGYSKIVLDWVKKYGSIKNKDFIRLDFNENRTYLKEMYYGNGFIKVKEYEENESHKLVLAEYRIGRFR